MRRQSLVAQLEASEAHVGAVVEQSQDRHSREGSRIHLRPSLRLPHVHRIAPKVPTCHPRLHRPQGPPGEPNEFVEHEALSTELLVDVGEEGLVLVDGGEPHLRHDREG